jgi:hypothetical protein
MLMKNLFFIAVMTLMGSLSAQSLEIDPVQFTSKPAAFNGKMVTVSKILINPSNPTPPAPGAISVAPGASVSTGAGTSSGTSATRCNAPRGFVTLDVDFPTDPTFQACFFISQAMFSALPKGQDKIQSTLTFKGDHRIGYTISLYKLGK